ncbi:MAG: Uma2 family endonuclease [Cyanobacteria bacterium J06635_15]
MALIAAKRFSVEEYHRLTELGFFQSDERLELIHGEIIQMAAKGVAHEVCLTRLLRELPKCLAETVTLRCQSPITLSPDSEPEPDFAIVRNRDDDYFEGHPQPADILWLIEVSDSSLAYDQSVKLAMYAAHGITHYWIFNLLDSVLECYSDPYQNQQGTWAYRMKRIYLPTETVMIPQLDTQSLLALGKVFPPNQ